MHVPGMRLTWRFVVHLHVIGVGCVLQGMVILGADFSGLNYGVLYAGLLVECVNRLADALAKRRDLG